MTLDAAFSLKEGKPLKQIAIAAAAAGMAMWQTTTFVLPSRNFLGWVDARERENRGILGAFSANRALTSFTLLS